MRSRCWGGVFEPIKPVEPPIEKPETPVEPPVEKPETPTTPPSTEDLITIKIEDDIMAVVGTETWNAIAYGNGKYVAVGSSKSIAESTDGVTWSTSEVFKTTASNIVYANGIFLVCNSFGSFSVSSDAVNWTNSDHVGGTLSSWYDAAYGNGQWVAVGENNTGAQSNVSGSVIASLDGISWTEQNRFPDTELIRSVAYGNDKFVAIYGRYVFLSEDGQNWTSHLVDIFPASLFLSKIRYANGLFITCGYDSSSTGYISTSADGVTWSEPYKTELAIWYDIAYHNGLFVCIGFGATFNGCKSVDGKNWTPIQITDENETRITKTLNGIIALP